MGTIIIYVQKNAWHPPKGKCQVLRRRPRTLWSYWVTTQPDHLSKCSIWVKVLAMRWHEQLKSKTCFLKKVICFKYGRSVSAKAIKIQYQKKTAESFRNWRRKKGKIEKEKWQDQERRAQEPREREECTDQEIKVQGPREKRNDFCKRKRRVTKTERSKILLFWSESKELQNPMKKSS